MVWTHISGWCHESEKGFFSEKIIWKKHEAKQPCGSFSFTEAF